MSLAGEIVEQGIIIAGEIVEQGIIQLQSWQRRQCGGYCAMVKGLSSSSSSSSLFENNNF
eukprot:CAMPEP_0170803024 /NCGR_PEP_ID=MMETSP0733-20121128/29721_1 /TAXON_ID=186038 /ORGANISM="Fragilariopsis kerguelensis, Strain L26-C5" /LENGTH=59 /DNA_ID=CAMNT_0011156521 /DNA_START=353 /DNA_END=532 /DNA_ORIENTATION=+